MAGNDFFEIDFLAVETAKSGDAITLRYQIDGTTGIHVIDGGFTDMGSKICAHIDTFYGNGCYIDNVILTHSDGDHARGLKTVLNERGVGVLWMNRPWLYVDELIDHFATYNSSDALRSRLRKCYPTLVELEEIALDRGIPIREVFQGSWVGPFVIMSPSKAMYLDLIIESEKTPEGVDESEKSLLQKMEEGLAAIASATITLVRAAWGAETFSPNETSAENEMSVVQAALIADKKILLTGDAGRRALRETIDFAPQVGLHLPGIDRFQVPHHGSRRNVSTDLLDELLGERLQYPEGSRFTAITSSAKADPHHPRPSVERAMHHRGATVLATEGQSICTFSLGAPARPGWLPISSRPYPEDEER